jgi:hypothetical protein
MTLLVSPAPRWSAVMAELPTSSELVLFGGKTTANLFNGVTAYSGVLNDTWAWNGTAWTNLSVGISGNTLTTPLPRYEAAMAFDGTYVTMVGGTDGHVNLSDTWSYNTGSGWFKQSLTDVVSPPSNYTIPTMQRGSAIAYQSGVSGGEVVLFGGISSFQRHYVLDTWVWATGNPGTWTELTPANYPNARTYAAMASSASTAVLFGGKSFDGGLSDTWTWNGTNWTQVAGLVPGSTCPSARYGAMMAYDGYTSNWVLFGGITTNGYSNETWTFNGTTWTQQTTGPAPMGRAYGAMAYHSGSSSVVMFGGLAYDRNLGDTWVWNGTFWTAQ